MKESYTKGVATHRGPESWGVARKGSTQALTGVRAGKVSSREIMYRRATGSSEWRRGSGPGSQHGQRRCREHLAGSARSETLCMHAKLHAREPGDPSDHPPQMVAAGRIGEAVL